MKQKTEKQSKTNQELEVKRNEFSDKSSKLKDMKNNKDLENKVEAQKDSIFNLKIELKDNQMFEKELSHQKESLDAELTKTKDRKSVLDGENNDLKGKIDTLSENIKEIKKNIEEAKIQNENSFKEFSRNKIESNKLKSDAEKIRTKLQSMDSSINSLNHQIYNNSENKNSKKAAI